MTDVLSIVLNGPYLVVEKYQGTFACKFGRIWWRNEALNTPTK